MKTLTVSELYQRFSLEYIQGLSTFGAIPADVVKRLLAEGDIFELEPDETLYQANNPVDEFYVILSGTLALYHHYHDKSALTHNYTPGQQIGFVGLIALHTRKGTAVANERCCVLSISRSQYYELHETAAEAFGLLTLNLAREMARTIGEMGDRIAELRNQ
jgi:CRP-like cAMP-binding protein